MPHHSCNAKAIPNVDYIARVGRGETVPLAFRRKDGRWHFASVLPGSVRAAQEPYAYRTDPGRWLDALHVAGLVVRACGLYAGVLHISWDPRTRERRAYMDDVARMLL